MAFAKVRQEAPFPDGNRVSATTQITIDHRDDGARPAGDQPQHAAIAGLQPALERGSSLLRTPLSKIRYASAGVTVSATSNDARMARM